MGRVLVRGLKESRWQVEIRQINTRKAAQELRLEKFQWVIGNKGRRVLTLQSAGMLCTD